MERKLEEKVRTIDELGRIVIPIEVREYLTIKPGDKIDILESGKNIILKKSKNIEKQINVDNGIEINIQITYLNNNSIHNCYTRYINELGMLVIPIEIRKNLNIRERDKMKICIKDESIILIKERYSFGKNENFNHNKRKKQCCKKVG